MKIFNRKIISGLLALLLAIGILPNVHAATVGTDETTATIIFTAGTGPIYPVDPEEPDEEEETNPVTGPLAIVSVSDFNFGQVGIASQNASFRAITEQPNVQVADLRGTGSGWRLSAQMSAFKDSAEELALVGATLRIDYGRANAPLPNFTQEMATLLGPVQDEDLLLVPGGSQIDVLKAAADRGMGLWVMRWYDDTVDHLPCVWLDVPVSAMVPGSYSATISWTLTDGP